MHVVLQQMEFIYRVMTKHVEQEAVLCLGERFSTRSLAWINLRSVSILRNWGGSRRVQEYRRSGGHFEHQTGQYDYWLLK